MFGKDSDKLDKRELICSLYTALGVYKPQITSLFIGLFFFLFLRQPVMVHQNLDLAGVSSFLRSDNSLLRGPVIFGGRTRTPVSNRNMAHLAANA